MTNLPNSSEASSTLNHRPFALLFLALAFLGFLDATYITINHYLGAVPPCVVTSGCETVLRSSYSSVMGVPVALIGALYYTLIIILSLGYLWQPGKKQLKKLAVLTTLGFLATLWFLYLQIFVIHALCFYCLVSAGTSSILFAGSWLAFARGKYQ